MLDWGQNGEGERWGEVSERRVSFIHVIFLGNVTINLGISVLSCSVKSY
jgi:hypothetical protein